VESPVEDDDCLTAGRRASDLDHVLDRLGAGIQKQALLLPVATRRELCEPAADLDVRLVHADHEALVQVAVHLLVDGRDGGRQPVAGVLAAEPSREVDVRAALDVLDPRALGPSHDEGRGRHSGRDVAFAGLDDGVGRGSLPQGHAASLLLNGRPHLGPRVPGEGGILAAVSATSLAVVLSLVAGLAGSVQVAVSGAFGKRIGVLEATAFGSITAALIVCAVLLVARQGVGNLGQSVREPPWLWIGGVMGAIVVTTITFTAPRIGTFATIGLLIAGQLAMGVLIDAFGLFGLEKIPVTPARVAGLVLLAVGAALVLKR
jgi:bacterial/archaeal transporter family-2 protein